MTRYREERARAASHLLRSILIRSEKARTRLLGKCASDQKEKEKEAKRKKVDAVKAMCEQHAEPAGEPSSYRSAWVWRSLVVSRERGGDPKLRSFPVLENPDPRQT